MKGMRKLIEMVMSLIVVAATYAVMHIIFISDLFNFTKKMPAYVPVALSVFTGFIFYLYFYLYFLSLLVSKQKSGAYTIAPSFVQIAIFTDSGIL